MTGVERNCILRYNLIDVVRTLNFIRYADNILLGYIGPKNEVSNIISLIKKYIVFSTGINVDTDKAEIQHHSKGILYLGYLIKGF